MLTAHSAKSSLLAPQRAEIQKEETQLIFYSKAFLHRNRQAVKCVRWLKPSVLKSRCCYKCRQGTQISQENFFDSFISQLCSFLGRVEKNWTFLWDQEPGRWYRFLFWMTCCPCADRHSETQTDRWQKPDAAEALINVSCFYFCPGLIGTVPTGSENVLFTESPRRIVVVARGDINVEKCGDVHQREQELDRDQHFGFLWWVILQLDVAKRDFHQKITQRDTTPWSPFSCEQTGCMFMCVWLRGGVTAVEELRSVCVQSFEPSCVWVCFQSIAPSSVCVCVCVCVFVCVCRLDSPHQRQSWTWTAVVRGGTGRGRRRRRTRRRRRRRRRRREKPAGRWRRKNWQHARIKRRKRGAFGCPPGAMCGEYTSLHLHFHGECPCMCVCVCVCVCGCVCPPMSIDWPRSEVRGPSEDSKLLRQVLDVGHVIGRSSGVT